MKALAIALLAGLGLLVLVDRIADAVAQGEIADRITAQEEVAETREVDITGFPFLTQAVSGTYDEIHVELLLAEGSALPGTSVSMRLHEVEVPLAQALSGTPGTVPVGSVEGAATLPYDSLSERIGPRTTLEPNSDGEGLRITRVVEMLGLEAPLSAVGRVSVQDGNVLAIRVDEARAVGVDVPEAYVQRGSELLDVDYELPPPPFGLELTTVIAARSGVVVGLRGGATEIGG